MTSIIYFVQMFSAYIVITYRKLYSKVKRKINYERKVLADGGVFLLK